MHSPEDQVSEMREGCTEGVLPRMICWRLLYDQKYLPAVYDTVEPQ